MNHSLDFFNKKNEYMKTKLLIVLMILGHLSSFSQQNFWKRIDHKNLVVNSFSKDRTPSSYIAYHADTQSIDQYMAKAPDLYSHQLSNIKIEIPDDNGQFVSYKIYKSGSMSKQLAQSTPQIHTYRGYGVKNPTVSASITINPMGIYISIYRNKQPTLSIQPANLSTQDYLVYNTKSLLRIPFNCQNFSHQEKKLVEIKSTPNPQIDDDYLRKYRYAIGTTGEYSQFHIDRAVQAGTLSSNATDAEKKDAVLAAVITTIDRVNTIYERDFGILLELVPNERDVIFLDANTDPYDNDDLGSMVYGNTNVLNNHIGNTNYDGGHLFSTNQYGGGSLLGVICSSNKGACVTGSDYPVTDTYDVDYVAHEIGHSFNCNHTFGNSCYNQRNLPTSIEPGSGSTIMAYAGVCSPNVQNNSNDYFSIANIQECKDFVTQQATCAQLIDLGNHKPIIDLPTNQIAYIPKSTPIILWATATDAEGDPLTFCWEEFDPETDSNLNASVPADDKIEGALFRTYQPKQIGMRILPKVANIFDGTYANTWEVLPAVNRDFTFALSVRDNHVGGGQSPYDFVSFSVDQNTGPFRITSQTTDETWQITSNQNITWNVANTNGGLVNCSHVDIYFSTDNGYSFSHILAENVPNSGSANIAVPMGINTQNGRIMIKGHNAYFGDLSKGVITVINSQSAETYKNIKTHIYPNPAKNTIHISIKNPSNQHPIDIQLLDMTGRQVFARKYNRLATQKFNKTIDIKSFSSGFYLIIIQNDLFITSQKIIIE